MKTPHKHAELIKAWADGAEIQHQHSLSGTWFDCEGDPKWEPYVVYRIKPERVTDFCFSLLVETTESKQWSISSEPHVVKNLKLTFDGETGKLKSAEVL